PAAIPSIASETARNERWYHVRTERSRPSRISSRRVANVVQNRPAKSIRLFSTRSTSNVETDAMRRHALIAEPRHALVHEVQSEHARSWRGRRFDANDDGRSLTRCELRGKWGPEPVLDKRPSIVVEPVIAGEHGLRFGAVPTAPSRVRDVQRDLECLR